jgi:hypothetical protein
MGKTELVIFACCTCCSARGDAADEQANPQVSPTPFVR